MSPLGRNFRKWGFNWSKIDILTLMGNVVDILIYLRANSKGSPSYQIMVFCHNEIMDWLVTDELYLNHMHDEETVIVEASV